jgi:anti-sigma-K factor RskA
MVKLVDGWKSAWKWASVQLAAAAVVALQLYEQFPQFQQYIPDKVFHHAMSAFVALIIVGRIIQQGNNVPPK